MNKIYSKINFLNRPSKKTPLNAANLNKMDEAIDGLDNRVVETNDALLVERARIDNLAKLPEGSTTGDAELIDGRVDYNGNTHTNIGTHIREVSSQLSSENAELKGDLVNYHNCVQYVKDSELNKGAYWANAGGNTGSNAEYACGTYELKAGKYYLWGCATLFTRLKSAGTKIGSEYAVECFELTLESDDTLYCTFNTTSYPLPMITNNGLKPENYTEGVYAVAIDGLVEPLASKNKTDLDNLKTDVDNLKNDKVNVIIVKKDGTGDFTSIVEALQSYSDSSPDNPYYVYIHEGEYDIIDELGGSEYVSSITSESSNSSGLILQNGTHLIGVGKKEKIILKGEISSDIATEYSTIKVSTVNILQSVSVENITITAKNMRYAVHDESGNYILYRNRRVSFKDCIIVHYANENNYWKSQSAYGAGCGNGDRFEYDNCTFISYASSGFGMHNNTSFTIPAECTFKYCKFFTYAEGQYCFGNGTVQSLTDKNYMHCYNCYFNTPIRCTAEKTGVTESGWIIDGCGNSLVPYYLSSGFSECVKFFDEIRSAKNVTNEVIAKGSVVKCDGLYGVSIASNSFEAIGIAMSDIAPDEIGDIKVNGYMRGSYAKGTKYTVNNGTLEASENNIFAYAISDDCISLN